MFKHHATTGLPPVGDHVFDVGHCFYTCGVHLTGLIQAIGQNGSTNHEKFTRAEGFYGGGMIVLPSAFRLRLRDLSFLENYGITYRWDRAFGGYFPHNGQVYNLTSLTLDIANVSEERMIEIAQDIACQQLQTDVLLKIFPARRKIFWVQYAAR